VGPPRAPPGGGGSSSDEEEDEAGGGAAGGAGGGDAAEHDPYNLPVTHEVVLKGAARAHTSKRVQPQQPQRR
jgi:hypothetical protein